VTDQRRRAIEARAYERQLGIAAGLAWLSKANASVFYLDRGMSEGIDAAWDAANRAGVPIEYRMLDRPRRAAG
jgi:hypothetical protein